MNDKRREHAEESDIQKKEQVIIEDIIKVKEHRVEGE